MMLGITFEEKILSEISLEEYFNIIKSSDINLLELAPNFIDYDIEFYKKIYKHIMKNNFSFTFHLPSFVDEGLSVSKYSESNEKYLSNYFKQLNQVFDLKNNPTTVVFHGCKYETIEKNKAFNQTLLFIKFLLKLFLKNDYNLSLSMETLNKNKHKIIGDSREDFIKMLSLVNSRKLKICWDITHDFLNYNKLLYPEGSILKAINHCHIHGFDGKKTHLNISNNPELYPAVKFAKKNNIPIIIELLMQENYLDILKEDISTIRSII